MSKVESLKQALWEYLDEHSQREVADQLGYSESYLSFLRSGDRPVTEELCARVIERIPSLGILGYEARQEITDERWRRMRAEAAR